MTRMNARFLWSWPLVAAAVLMAPRIASAAVTAAIVGNQLQVTGDAADDSITLRLVAGALAVGALVLLPYSDRINGSCRFGVYLCREWGSP